MTTLRARLHHVFAGVIAVGLLALGATDAQATHFRYGTMRWEVIPTVPPNTPGQTRIKVTAETAWRRSFSWPGGQAPQLGVPLSTGQTILVQSIASLATVGSSPLDVTPSSINNAEDWFVGSTLREFQFATTNLPVRIFFEGNARVSNLADLNADDTFRVESVMSAAPNAASPVASILPIITVGYPLPAATFFIPAGDVEGDTMTWSIAPQARSRLTKAAPDGFDDIPPPTLSINPLTGEVTWATNQERSPADPQPPFSEFYAVQFIVTDSKGGETPVDAFLRLIVTVPNPPIATINGSENQHIVFVRPNNPATFTLTGTDNDAGATVTLTSGNLPPGASMTPSLPTVGSSPRSSQFNWTPTLAQAGNSYTVSFAVTDEFGNQDTISAVITVLANFPPSVTCPAPQTVEADQQAGASSVTLTATVNDQDPEDITVKWFVDGTLVKTETVTGPGPNTVTHTQAYPFLPAPHVIRVETNDGQLTRECTSEVTVVDTTPPVLSLPADITREATNPVGEVVTFTATATDTVDGNVPVTCVPASGSTFPIATTVVNCSATDAHGNTSTGSFNVTVQDTTPPVLTLPADITREATNPAGEIVTFTATAVDAVDGNVPVTCVPPSGSLFTIGTTTVNCSATDSHANTATGSFRVIVQDTAAPVVTVPANMTLEATSPAGAQATFTATAMDAVDGPITPTCVQPSGSTFPLGVSTVVCSATDSHGNTGSASFQITVQDTIPPVISGTSNQVREATGPSGAVVTWPTPTATDIADPNVPVSCSPASGSTFAITPPAPVATVTCTATDDSGNSSTATFTVRVQDTTPPVISNMPANISVPAAGGGAIVTWPSPTAFDIVDLARPVTCVPASGTFFPLGTTPVTCTASDTRGNTSTASFTVTVTNGDTKPPQVCLTLQPGNLWPPNHRMRQIRVLLTVRDNQDPTPTCAITSVTSTEPVTGKNYGNFAPDWIFSGLNLQLRAERYSRHGRTYTVTVLCSDDAGNTTTTRGTVRVAHDQGHRGGDDFTLMGGENDTNGGGNSSGRCCVRRDDRDRDHDDDDDFNLVWTNDATKKGPHENDRCSEYDDDDDDDATLKPDPFKTN